MGATVAHHEQHQREWSGVPRYFWRACSVFGRGGGCFGSHEWSSIFVFVLRAGVSGGGGTSCVESLALLKDSLRGAISICVRMSLAQYAAHFFREKILPLV